CLPLSRAPPPLWMNSVSRPRCSPLIRPGPPRCRRRVNASITPAITPPTNSLSSCCNCSRGPPPWHRSAPTAPTSQLQAVTHRPETCSGPIPIDRPAPSPTPTPPQDQGQADPDACPCPHEPARKYGHPPHQDRCPRRGEP